MNEPSELSPAAHPSETETLLFRTQINGAWQAFDPWRLGRILARELAGEPLGKVIATARGQPQYAAGQFTGYLILDHDAAFAAGERLYRAVAVAFGLSTVQPDGSGVTEQTLHRLVNEYVAWKSAVKKISHLR